MRSLYLILAFMLLSIFPVYASNAPIGNYIKEADTVGNARYTYILLDVYDATLYAPKGQWSFKNPFALRLKYLRNLSGKRIADRSAKEIRHQGYKDEITLADWHAQMTNIFPDVQTGTSLTGIYKPDHETVFYKDDELIGRIHDPNFGRWFFGIWLSENTSEPDFRKTLLGHAQ